MPTLPSPSLCARSLFTDPATTDIYPLSLHDALPISRHCFAALDQGSRSRPTAEMPSAKTCAVSSDGVSATGASAKVIDRKSTRLNSSHANISYAVFCLKKKKRRLRGRERPAEDEIRW